LGENSLKAFFPPALEMSILLLILLAIALTGTQLLLGGKAPAFCLPGYGVLALASVLSGWPLRRVAVSRHMLLCLASGAIFFGYLLVRALCSEDHYLARKDLYLGLAALIVYLLVALNVTSPRLRVLLVSVLLFLGVVDTVIGGIQYQRGDSFMPFEFLPAVGYGLRARGFFGSPNHLAGFLEVMVLLGLSVTVWSSWPWWGKILFGYGSIVCIVGSILTGSRGGYLGLGLGLFALLCLSALVISQRGRPSLALALMGMMVVMPSLGLWSTLALLPVDSNVRDRINSVASLRVNVDDCRPHLWTAAVRQFGESPIVGTGSGTYLYYGRQFRDPAIQSDPIYAHNDYLQLLGEYGIVGAAGFLFFAGCHFFSGWNALRRQSLIYEEHGGAEQGSVLALTMGAFCGSVAIAAHSCVDFNLHIPANALLMAFVFGVLANPGGETVKLDHPWTPALRVVLPVAGLGLAAAALPTLPAEYHVERAKALLTNASYLESGEVAARIVEFAQQGLRYDAGNTELYYCLGEGHFALAEKASSSSAESRLHHERAVAAYRKARQIAPRDVRLFLCEATSLDAMERFDESEAILARALELDPNSHYVLNAYASHLYAQKKFARAEAEYQKAAQAGSPGARYWLETLAEDKKAGRLGATSSGVQARPAAP
jgi:O-antigen ligase